MARRPFFQFALGGSRPAVGQEPALQKLSQGRAPASAGWIGVELDGTLAVYDGWVGATEIGDPIPAMVDRVRMWLNEGRDVRIFTARISHGDADAIALAIREWCVVHLGQALVVTNVKDIHMLELWDDRAIQVHRNTGQRADGRP